MDTLEIQLVEAIRNSRLDVVEILLSKGVNINYVPSCGKSPLSTAAALGHTHLINILLKNKTNFSVTQEHYTRRDQRWAGGLEDDKENQNDNLSLNNRTGYDGKNLGYYVFVHGDDSRSKESWSLNKNESLDAETPEGMDGLEWDVEVEGIEGDEPDDIWSNQYRWYADILDKTGGLVEDQMRGCDVNLQDYSGRCAVHYAVEYSQLGALHCLISAGCKVNVGDSDGVTPLHLAVVRDHQEIASLLLQHRANVNAKTLDKMTPLHYASCRGLVQMVELLIEHGATIDSQDANDRTALIMAVSRRHLDVVETLIKHKAKVNMEEIHGYTPLCEAVWNKSVEMAEALLRAGAKPHHSQHLLHYTVLHRHLDMAALLLRYGTYPNLRDDHGDTPLLLAINCSHLEMIKLLLEHDANPNCANSVNGITPLHQAISSVTTPAMFDEILTLLCQYNVDLNLPSVGTYLTPLISTIQENKITNAVSLIRAGADVNCLVPSLYWQNIPLLRRCDRLPMRGEWMLREDISYVHLIVAAGYDLSNYCADHPKDFTDVNVESLEGFLLYMKFNPKRLSDLCRLNIRAHMGNQVLQLVPTLDIPFSLKKFLLFEDIWIFEKESYSYPNKNSKTFLSSPSDQQVNS